MNTNQSILDSALMRGLFHSKQKLDLLLEPNGKPSNRIKVKGFTQIHEVTVQVFEDDILVHCNHANTELEKVYSDEGTDDERSEMLHVCNKNNCGYVFPLEESYYE